MKERKKVTKKNLSYNQVLIIKLYIYNLWKTENYKISYQGQSGDKKLKS